MASPLAGLATTIHGALKGIFFDAVLTREVVPASPAYDPADPPAPVLVNYPCKAIRDRYSSFDRNGTDILTSDVKILVLAKSITITPAEDDFISVNGGPRFRVVTIDTDPATACWVLQGRT